MELKEQRAETEAAFAEMAADPDMPARASLVFAFLPADADADWDALTEAAEAAGYEVAWAEPDEDGTAVLEIATDEIALTLDALWAEEERLTLMAAVHGFEADGWAVFGD
ncbi:MAG: ribonuclease E inhibitor RraB [Rhodobacteraceae bacterium]|jgi:regulator of RNase E activity RraB|nr:ribonuclease E inhibitor RraB [Paracoccaceae bacterium]